MRRVVLDTNVLVSAFIKKVGKPAQILRQLDKFVLLIAHEILAELDNVLHRSHIQRKFQLTDEQIADYILWLQSIGYVVQIDTPVSIVNEDPDDNKILACAIDGGAAYIVSGDPHLLDLREVYGIYVVTPAAFLDLLQNDLMEEL